MSVFFSFLIGFDYNYVYIVEEVGRKNPRKKNSMVEPERRMWYKRVACLNPASL